VSAPPNPARMKTRRQQWLGCGGCVVVFAALGALLVSSAGVLGPLFVVLAAVVAGALAVRHITGKRRATDAFRAAYRSDGKDTLIVYTESPHWKNYIEANWLPRWGDRAVMFDRSRPWKEDSVEARLWRAVAGRVEHTPVVIVVPSRGRAEIVRFWLAFRDFKHGKDRALREAEARLARILDAQPR
jgi:hypothetical protein